MRTIAILLTFTFPLLCWSQGYLLDNEEVVFEFQTERNKKLSIAKDTADEYLVYRFGTNEKVEFEFPSDKSNSWNKFKFSWYARGGGIANEGMSLDYLYFENGGFKYVVFRESTARSGTIKYGILVINLITEKRTTIKTNPNTVTGGLYVFRDNEKIT